MKTITYVKRANVQLQEAVTLLSHAPYMEMGEEDQQRIRSLIADIHKISNALYDWEGRLREGK